jgi:hypothetical protein
MGRQLNFGLRHPTGDWSRPTCWLVVPSCCGLRQHCAHTVRECLSLATTMNHQSPKPLAPLDALDFEITDFDEARRALDELPAGAGFRPRYWLN